MKNQVSCNALVDLDSFLEEIRESFTDKEKIELVMSICWGFDKDSSFKNVVEKLAREYEKNTGAEMILNLHPNG